MKIEDVLEIKMAVKEVMIEEGVISPIITSKEIKKTHGRAFYEKMSKKLRSHKDNYSVKSSAVNYDRKEYLKYIDDEYLNKLRICIKNQ